MHTMKAVMVLCITLAAFPITAPVPALQSAGAAAVTLEVQPPSPTAGSEFTVAIHVNLEGGTGQSSAPVALGGFVIPVAFDSNRVTLYAASKGSASGLWPELTYTDIHMANTLGCVTVVNAQAGMGVPTVDAHVATLTFTADQGGTVQFNVNSARARWEGSLASTYEPVGMGGPSSITYDDPVVPVRIEQGSRPYRLIYPSFVSTRHDFQGVSIVNESPASAALIFRALGLDGRLLAGPGMVNPSAPTTLAARAQYVKVVEEMFALGDVSDSDHGWIEVESTSPNTSGFFLVGHTVNGSTTELDGTDVSHALTARAIFPVAGYDPARETNLCVINPGAAPAAGNMRLRRGDGTIQEDTPVSIPARGVYEQVLRPAAMPGDGYVELEMSSGRVTGFEKFGTARALACLAAQEIDRAANTLYAPHLASGSAGARYFTEISIINTNSQPANAVFRLLNDIGQESAGAVTRTIGAGSKLRIRADRLFELPDPATAEGYTTGVITVESDREMVGSVTFGDPGGEFLSSLPLLSPASAKREIYLDHVALGTLARVTYWTGIAVVNASRERDARVAIRLYRPDGELVGETARTIPRRGRLLTLVSELGPGFSVNQFGGFVHITSDVEVFAVMLFGDTGPTFLSAVPVR